MPEDPCHHPDDLSDVVLEGRRLVSDNPADWLLCCSLQDTTDLFGWWEDLVKWDDNAAQTFSPAVLQQLRSLQAEFQMAYESDSVSANGRRRIRRILMAILSLGLTTDQAATLCGQTRSRITQLLIAQHILTPPQIEARMRAESLLRSGLGPSEVRIQCGMTRSEIEKWASTLSIRSAHRNKFGRSKPKVLKDRAMELYDSGLRGVGIVKILRQEMPELAEGLSDELVGQWARRSGRTKRQQVA